MELTKILIPKDRFCQIPKEERVVFVLLGHLANELSVLGKLMGWCRNGPSASPAEENARLFQTLFMVRLLAGKLNEGWQALQRSFFGTAIAREYEGLIEEPHRSDLQQLKRYFGRENSIHRVRNDFSFHYSVDDVARCVDLPAELRDELVIYLGKEHENSLYSLGELICNLALFQAVAVDDPQRAVITLLNDVWEVRRLFLSVISGCMWVFVSRHLGKDPGALKAETISVDAPTDGRRFAIPYFVSTSGDVGTGSGVR